MKTMPEAMRKTESEEHKQNLQYLHDTSIGRSKTPSFNQENNYTVNRKSHNVWDHKVPYKAKPTVMENQ